MLSRLPDGLRHTSQPIDGSVLLTLQARLDLSAGLVGHLPGRVLGLVNHRRRLVLGLIRDLGRLLLGLVHSTSIGLAGTSAGSRRRLSWRALRRARGVYAWSWSPGAGCPRRVVRSTPLGTLLAASHAATPLPIRQTPLRSRRAQSGCAGARLTDDRSAIDTTALETATPVPAPRSHPVRGRPRVPASGAIVEPRPACARERFCKIAPSMLQRVS